MPPLKEEILGHLCDTTVALVPSRVMKGHIVTIEIQTELSVQVVLPNGEFKALRVLVDFGCQAVALANPNVFGDQISEKYGSPQWRRLLQANNETPLPGGNEQIDVKNQFTGVMDGSVSLPRVAQHGVSPYLVPNLPRDMVLGPPWSYEHCVSHFARFYCLYYHHRVHPRFWIEDFGEAPRTGKPFLVQPIHGKVSRQSVWGITVPIIGAVIPTHPAPAIVVTPPGGERPNGVKAEKHISSALTASSVAPVQDRTCALELVEFAPETLARDVLPTRRDGSMWTQSDYGLTPYWAARVQKPFGKNPDVDAFNRAPGMTQATCWVSPLEDFFSTPPDPSKLYWMCPPYHRFSDCVQKIRQEKLRAIVVGPKWTHREWWKPLMEVTLQGYHLSGPETKACLYQNDRLTSPPQRSWSTVALYVDGIIAKENLAAIKCHVASVLAPAVSNPNTDGEPGMTAEEESDDERVSNHWVSVRTLTYQATHKKVLAPVTLDPTPEDLEAQECVPSRIAKIEQELLGGRATTVKRYLKTKGATRLLAASRVGAVVSTQEPIVSPEVELLRKRILADYERDVFSGEVRLRPGQEHPKVRGTERLGFAKLDLYPNAKPKSVKPIRLVGERAAAEKEMVEDFLARGWIEPCPASEWASNGFVVPKKEKGKWRLVVDYRQLNEAILPDAHPLPLIENMLENQSKHKIFTIVDLSKGFHQIPLHPESRAKTAMNLAGKRYQWRVMPMGIKNGPAIFQRVMDHVFQGLDCADYIY